MRILIGLLFALLLVSGCGTSNADFAKANAELGQRLSDQLQAVRNAVEGAGSGSECASPPALTWARSGPHNVEFVPLVGLGEPNAKVPISLQAVTYSNALGSVTQWLDPRSKNYIGKKQGNVTSFVEELTEEVKGLDYLVVTKVGDVNFETGKLDATGYLVSLKDAAIVCRFDFASAADPQAATEAYKHVEVGTGKVVNEHRVGFSDRLAASLGQNFKDTVKTRFGISLTR